MDSYTRLSHEIHRESSIKIKTPQPKYTRLARTRNSNQNQQTKRLSLVCCSARHSITKACVFILASFTQKFSNCQQSKEKVSSNHPLGRWIPDFRFAASGITATWTVKETENREPGTENCEFDFFGTTPFCILFIEILKQNL